MEQRKFDPKTGSIRTLVMQSGVIRLLKENESITMSFEEAANAVDVILRAMTYMNKQYTKAQEGIPGAIEKLKTSNQEAQEMQGRFQDIVKDL